MLNHVNNATCVIVFSYYIKQAPTSRLQDKAAHDQIGCVVYSRLDEAVELCHSSLRAGTASLQQHQHPPHLTDLPIVVQLHIFSYLDAHSLCSLAQTCSRLNERSCDPLLWSRLLVRDSRRWSVLGHLSYPQHYHTAQCDLTPKQVYRACYCRRECQPERSFAHPVTTRLKSLMRRLQGHIPRLLVFGSGLETLPFIRNLMWQEHSPYKPVGMFPGKDGVGSGVCVEHDNRPVNLVTLYRAPQAERRSGCVNKLLDSSRAQITVGVQEQCQQADGLLLVIDPASTDFGAVEDSSLLRAMLAYCSAHTPLLVVTICSEEGGVSNSDAPLLWAERLHLEQVTHPWQVRRTSLGSYSGLVQGVDWLLRASQ